MSPEAPDRDPSGAGEAARTRSGLEVSGLRLARGGSLLLAGASFSLAPGAIALLTGPNGVGKTTLLRALAGLLPVEAGRVAFDGDASADRRRLTLFFGHLDGVKPALSVRENLDFWSALYQRPAAAGRAAAVEFGLGDRLDRPAAALSAGQRRRLGFCRALISAKPYWLLDEPTASLDRASVERFVGLVRAHAASGGAALIATHETLPLPEAKILSLSVGEAA